MIGEGVAAVLLVTVVDSSRNICRMIAKLQVGDLLLGDFCPSLRVILILCNERDCFSLVSAEAVKFGGKSKRTNRYTFKRLGGQLNLLDRD